MSQDDTDYNQYCPRIVKRERERPIYVLCLGGESRWGENQAFRIYDKYYICIFATQTSALGCHVFEWYLSLELLSGGKKKKTTLTQTELLWLFVNVVKSPFLSKTWWLDSKKKLFIGDLWDYVILTRFRLPMTVAGKAVRGKRVVQWDVRIIPHTQYHQITQLFMLMTDSFGWDDLNNDQIKNTWLSYQVSSRSISQSVVICRLQFKTKHQQSYIRVV